MTMPSARLRSAYRDARSIWAPLAARLPAGIKPESPCQRGSGRQELRSRPLGSALHEDTRVRDRPVARDSDLENPGFAEPGPESDCHTARESLARFSAGVDEMREIAAEEGRDPATIDLAYWAVWYGAGGDEPLKADNGERMLLTGSADDIAGDIKALKEIGVRRVLLQFLREDIGQTIDAMTHFAEEIRPRAQG